MNQILKQIEFYYTSFLAYIPRLGMAVLTIVVGFILVAWISSFIKSRISKKSHDPLMSNFLGNAIRAVLVICVLLLGLQAAGLSGIASAILGTAGASVIILGFAFKDIAENFIAGIILSFNRPFHIEDTVQIESVFGRVKSMEFRYTKIATFDGRNIFIPNADILTKPVINFTENGFYRTDFIVGIAYENNIEQAKAIIMKCLEEASEVIKDDIHINFVAEDELAASTVNLKVFFWVSTEDFRRGVLMTRGRLIQEVKNNLENAGFNLPANITELKFYEASKSFPVKNVEIN